MSQAKLSSAYEELSIPERIELLQRLWDELATQPENIELTDAQRAELDRRLDDYRRDPNAGLPWDSLREKLRNTP